MAHWQSKLAKDAKAGSHISWNDAVLLCGPLRGSLITASDPERTQLLDQFAAWINEGGKGREPIR
jgi:hypothetical protein